MHCTTGQKIIKIDKRYRVKRALSGIELDRTFLFLILSKM